MAYANKKQIPFYITDEERQEIVGHAKRLGISQQKFLARILKHGLAKLAKGETLEP